MPKNLRIDSERLWQSLIALAEIGATSKGGCCRLALSDEDKAGRDLFVAWCREAGCDISVDRLGNIFARRAGRNPTLPAVATGSHLDTQPHGGKFDGAYGVLAGLEVVRTLNDQGIETEAPIEVAVWTNEEGARFAPSMIASGVFAGSYDEDFALACADADGRTLGEELARIGYAGSEPCGARAFGAFFEAHIEQGPILEREEKIIGAVTGVQGLCWYDVTVRGQDAHSGSTPMPGRRNALLGAAEMVSAVDALALEFAPDAVATVGQLDVSPNSRNTIPGEVFFTVDIRHPASEVMTEMDARFRDLIAQTATRRGLDSGVERIAHTPPVVFHRDCVDAVRRASEALGYASRDILSGAGHDACHLSKVTPTGMIFVPCAGGLSHNEEESAEASDLAAGCNVLLHAMLARAG
ncbi:MAG TPA: Zn-dependent hydrolase [Gammaproteobacteria bacterium]|nr:Zn-dependent hydrolase [Gammaproteobacteria bacterium]